MKMEAGVVIHGRYEIVHKVADGGMGELYYARDLKLSGMPRALKILKPMFSSDRQQLLKQEAYLLTRLQHRCLPSIYDFEAEDSEGSRSIIIMEWIDGMHLGELLKLQANIMTLPFICYIATEILSALTYLHAQQPRIIHRDLKPANIMICTDGTIKLIDFGISKLLGEREEVTQQFGTRGYAAPEQLLGQKTDERSDIYSFGAVLLAMLGLDPVFYLADRNMERELSKKMSALTKELVMLIGDCVQQKPQHRPQSAGSVSSMLQQIAKKYGWDDYKQSMTQLAVLLQGRKTANLCIEAGREKMKSAERNGQRGLGKHAGRKIALIGAHVGAGTTMLSLALAHCFSRENIHLAYIEHRSGAVEPASTYTLDAMPQFHDEQRWEQYGSVHYCFAEQMNGKRQESSLQRTHEIAALQAFQRNVLVDYSSHWQEQHIDAIVQQADWLIIVSSPWLVRYSCEMSKLQRLLIRAAEQQMPIIWISNRDQPFRDRSKWLELSAELTHLKVPELPAKIVLKELWNNGNILPQSPIVKKISDYLMPLIKKVIRLQ